MISTLEEISLHQEELENINEVLGNKRLLLYVKSPIILLKGMTCRNLKILYLQNNIIPKMENLSHLKGNNNIEVIINIIIIFIQ